MPANSKYATPQNKDNKCFICEKGNADSYFNNRFTTSVHKKCYEPIFEIEHLYEYSIYYNVDFKEFTSKRETIIKEVYRQIKAQKFDSFEHFLGKKGKSALDAAFCMAYYNEMRTNPEFSRTAWNRLSKSNQFIPEGNENILAVKKWTDLTSFLVD